MQKAIESILPCNQPSRDMDEHLKLIIWAYAISTLIVSLAASLTWSVWIVYRDSKVDVLPKEDNSAGRALETHSLIGLVQQVRSDYTAATPSKPAPTPRHRQHLAAARARVGVRSYFKHTIWGRPDLQPELNQF